MADDKKAPATEEHSAPEATSPETPGGVPAQPTVETVTAEQTHTPTDNVIPFGEAGTDIPSPGEEDTREPWEKTQDELNAESQKPRRGRPPKAAEQTGPEGEKKPEEKASRKGRQPKAAPDKAAQPVRDKVSCRVLVRAYYYEPFKIRLYYSGCPETIAALRRKKIGPSKP